MATKHGKHKPTKSLRFLQPWALLLADSFFPAQPAVVVTGVDTDTRDESSPGVL